MKTSKKDFEKFKGFCKKWVDYFGVTDWEIEISHKSPKGIKELKDRDPVAWTWFCVQGRRATISLNTEWGSDKPTERNLELTAFHEVYEVMLGEQTEIGSRGDASVDEKERVRHAFIARMSNALMGDVG